MLAAPVALTARPVVHVEAYRKPGLTDSQVIQAAVDAAAQLGGAAVHLSGRTYTFTETVNLATGVDIVGQGATIAWPRTGPAFTFFRADGVADLSIEGVRFQWSGRPEAAATVQTHAVVLENSRNIDLTRNTFLDSKAIHVVGSSDVRVKNNEFLRGAEGIVVGALVAADIERVPLSRDIYIIDNVFRAQRREAVDVNSNASDIHIRGNVMTGGDARRAGIEAVDELIDIGGGYIRNVYVSENILNAAGSYTHAVRVKLGASNVHFTKNTVSGLLQRPESVGIEFRDVGGIHVTENTFSSNTSGILLSGHVSGSISANSFTAPDLAHIQIRQALGEINLDRNVSNGHAAKVDGTVSIVRGGDLADTMNGTPNVDKIDAGSGGDWLQGHAGDDTLLGAAGADTLDGGYDADLLIGGSGGDLLLGGAGNDTLDGGDGADRLDSGAGDDLVIGGAGLDTVLFSGARDSYSIAWDPQGSAYIVRGPDGEDTLVGVERLQFADGLLAFDMDGSAGQVARLYQAALGRRPDSDGLKFWIGQADAGSGLREIAEHFQESREFSERFGHPETMQTDNFVDLLYKNVLGRPADEGGRQFYITQIENGSERSEVLIAISESAENRSIVGIAMQDGIWMA